MASRCFDRAHHPRQSRGHRPHRRRSGAELRCRSNETSSAKDDKHAHRLPPGQASRAVSVANVTFRHDCLQRVRMCGGLVRLPQEVGSAAIRNLIFESSRQPSRKKTCLAPAQGGRQAATFMHALVGCSVEVLPTCRGSRKASGLGSEVLQSAVQNMIVRTWLEALPCCRRLGDLKLVGGGGTAAAGRCAAGGAPGTPRRWVGLAPRTLWRRPSDLSTRRSSSG